MKKKDFIALFDKYDDDAEVELWADDIDDEVVKAYVFPSENLEKEAFKVYQEIISAIADGVTNDWVDICDAIDLDNNSYVGVVGMIHGIYPERIEGRRVFYRIDENDIKSNDRLYTGLFEKVSNSYWVHQVTQFEDDYSGQMIIDIGGNNYLVVGYHC